MSSMGNGDAICRGPFRATALKARATDINASVSEAHTVCSSGPSNGDYKKHRYRSRYLLWTAFCLQCLSSPGKPYGSNGIPIEIVPPPIVGMRNIKIFINRISYSLQVLSGEQFQGPEVRNTYYNSSSSNAKHRSTAHTFLHHRINSPRPAARCVSSEGRPSHGEAVRASL